MAYCDVVTFYYSHIINNYVVQKLGNKIEIKAQTIPNIALFVARFSVNINNTEVYERRVTGL